MPKSIQNDWPVVLVSNQQNKLAISKAVRSGRLRKIASRLYTTNFEDNAEHIVRQHIWQIVASFFPGALIADRTALEYAPALDGSICLITQEGTDIQLPGLILRPRRGTAPLPDDNPFLNGLYLSSFPRALLENMRPSRARGGKVARTLSREEMEEIIEKSLQRGGEAELNRWRDAFKVLAPQLELEAEANQLNGWVSALLGTQKADSVTFSSPIAKARIKGRPYDPQRLTRFELLANALQNTAPVIRPSTASEGQALYHLAFFEAYFSNFIEGTEFEVEEARQIVFEGRIPANRPNDAHDVWGTYQVAVDVNSLRQPLRRFEDFFEALRERHRVIMAKRPEKEPGVFKRVSNRAGESVFVDPELVEGTLEQGFLLSRSLDAGFARAVFMMFLVAEVHPFSDGNGRIARLMMNAELVAAAEQRIVIPTVYRNNYIAALKALTQTDRPQPLIRVLDFAQKWTAYINWQDFDIAQQELHDSNAFLDANTAEDSGKRLRLPTS